MKPRSAWRMNQPPGCARPSTPSLWRTQTRSVVTTSWLRIIILLNSNFDLGSQPDPDCITMSNTGSEPNIFQQVELRDPLDAERPSKRRKLFYYYQLTPPRRRNSGRPKKAHTHARVHAHLYARARKGYENHLSTFHRTWGGKHHLKVQNTISKNGYQ